VFLGQALYVLLPVELDMKDNVKLLNQCSIFNVAVGSKYENHSQPYACRQQNIENKVEGKYCVNNKVF